MFLLLSVSFSPNLSTVNWFIWHLPDQNDVQYHSFPDFRIPYLLKCKTRIFSLVAKYVNSS